MIELISSRNRFDSSYFLKIFYILVSDNSYGINSFGLYRMVLIT